MRLREGTASLLLERAARADILVGTQILAKATISSASRWWASSTPTAAFSPATTGERADLLRSLQQVSGARRTSKPPGEVLVQTRYPAIPCINPLVKHDYTGFARSVRRSARRRDFRLSCSRRRCAPKATTRCGDALPALGDRARAAEACSYHAVRSGPDGFCAGLAGMERAQALLAVVLETAPARHFLSSGARPSIALPSRGVRWHLDVDPVEF